MKAMFVLARANRAQHENHHMHLENTYTAGCNEYPMCTMELLSMMNNWKADPDPKQAGTGQPRINTVDRLNFPQDGKGGGRRPRRVK